MMEEQALDDRPRLLDFAETPPEAGRKTLSMLRGRCLVGHKPPIQVEIRAELDSRHTAGLLSHKTGEHACP